MKLKHYANRQSSIMAATHPGTTFYTISLEDVRVAMQSGEANIWIDKAFAELGWDAIDFEHSLFGSQIIDNVLYLCITDGQDIEVQGRGVDPESALEAYQVEHLSAYIQQGTPEVITKYITQYEIKTPNFNKWAADLLAEGHSFTDIVKDAQEFADF